MAHAPIWMLLTSVNAQVRYSLENIANWKKNCENRTCSLNGVCQEMETESYCKYLNVCTVSSV